MIVLASLCGAPWRGEAEEAVTARFPESVRRHVQQYQRPEDRTVRYTARLLLLHGLTNLMGLPDDCLERWTVDKAGRPFLDGLDVDFSISHAGEMAVCAIATNGRVGVDVEFLRTLNPKEFSFLFTAAEMTAIDASPDPSAELLRRWTMKEALLKAEGSGFSTPSSGQPDTTAKLTWRLTQVDVGDGYCCHVAAHPHATVTALRPPPHLIPEARQ